MKEAQELSIPTEEYFAQPVEDNLFEWHFTVRGPPDSDFDGGVYHGRIILPPEYPMKPPSIILLNPNGRFEVNKKICLSISGHHPESWQPSWSIRTALLALIGFMPSHGGGAIGSLDYSAEERKALSKQSKTWICTNCGTLENILKDRSEGPESIATSLAAKEFASRISFKGEHMETQAKKYTENKQATRLDNGEVDAEENDQEVTVRQRFVLQETRGIVQEPQTGSQPSSEGIPWNMIIIVLSLAFFLLLLRRVLLV